MTAPAFVAVAAALNFVIAQQPLVSQDNSRNVRHRLLEHRMKHSSSNARGVQLDRVLQVTDEGDEEIFYPLHADKTPNDNDELLSASISKAPNYNGRFNPSGTIKIKFEKDKTASYQVDVSELDDSCTNEPRDEDVDPSHCLCGYCADCSTLLGEERDACNDVDQCVFVGHGFAKPTELFLRLQDGADQSVSRIRVYFGKRKRRRRRRRKLQQDDNETEVIAVENMGDDWGQSDDEWEWFYWDDELSDEDSVGGKKLLSDIDGGMVEYGKTGGSTSNDASCTTVVDKADGLFHLVKPPGCNDKKEGIGTEISIDYTNDDNPDVSIHTSCSVPMHSGMKIENSPFEIEGYCVGNGKCSHASTPDDNYCVGVTPPLPLSEDEDDDRHCLCGYCADCSALSGQERDACNEADQCVFVGHGYAKPTAMYLKTVNDDEAISQIRVFFGKRKRRRMNSPTNKTFVFGSMYDNEWEWHDYGGIGDTETDDLSFNGAEIEYGKKGSSDDSSCTSTVDKLNGLFHIVKPVGCNDKKEGIGTEISIDYTNDGEPDLYIHTSCSVPLYAGMILEGNVFEIEGYCISNGQCSHTTDPICPSPPSLPIPPSSTPSRSPSSQPNHPTSRPTTLAPSKSPIGSPSMRPTDKPMFGPPSVTPSRRPSSWPTNTQTLSPTSKPTSASSAKPTLPPIRRTPLNEGAPPELALFDPNSTLSSYTSAGCGPRGHDAQANLSQCFFGFRLVEAKISSDGIPVSNINNCLYYSFKKYECMEDIVREANTHRRAEDTSHKLGESHRDLSGVTGVHPSDGFFPDSLLTGYVSEECGPRGTIAGPDFSLCPRGFELATFVPYHDGIVVAEVDGCNYLSLEVYQCLGDLDGEIAFGKKKENEDNDAGPVGGAVLSGSASNSCSVVVTDGPCEDPYRSGPTVLLGSASAGRFSLDLLPSGMNGMSALIHDVEGVVIGCGEIKEPTNSKCMCGYCEGEKCIFVGNGYPRPTALYLRLRVPDFNLFQIRVYFGKQKRRLDGITVESVDGWEQSDQAPKGNTGITDDLDINYFPSDVDEVVNKNGGSKGGSSADAACTASVYKDAVTGLFEIRKPSSCDSDGKPGLGTEISIDYINYIGNYDPDLYIHTSCSDPLFAGMELGGSPFEIEGYCIEDGLCTHTQAEFATSVCAI